MKTLLLASAAALAFGAVAQAADAVVAADPEPMDYVKVCDAFGAGFFYIPGTETCLKLGGRIRFDVKSADSYKADSDHGWNTLTRAELYMDAATDTEYGPLKTKFIARHEFAGTYNDGTHTVTKLIAANISLAGFQAGLADSLYTTFTSYAGDVANDEAIRYGRKETNQISYTYQAGGLKASLGVEADDDNAYADPNGNDYVPNVVAGVSYSAETFGVAVVGGYDDTADAGAIKGRLDGKFGALSVFVMGAWNTDGGKIHAFAPGDGYASWGDWAAWGGLGYKFSDALAANLQVAGTDNDTFAAAANVKWSPASGFVVQPEVAYTKWDNKVVNDDQWNGMVRFQRTF
jgi:hypothetical protein